MPRGAGGRSTSILAVPWIALIAAIALTGTAEARKAVFDPPCGHNCRQKNLPFTGVFADPMTASERTNFSAVERSASMQAQAGTDWVRISISWSALQPSSGTGMDPVQLAAYDAQVRAARAAGTKVLLTVSDSPWWARRGTPPDDVGNPPSDLHAYRAFLIRLTGHFLPLGVAGYEIWNEPNLHSFWNHPSPARYVSLLKAAHAAIKSQDPGALIVAGALAPVRADISPNHFLRRMYAAGARGKFDVLSVHVFPFGDPHQCTRRHRRPVAVKDLCYVERYRRIQQRNDDRMPIWVTEFGYGTNGLFSVDATDQSRYLTAGFKAARRYRYLRMIVWYTFRDLDPSPKIWTQSSGLVTSDFTPKPSFEAFQRVAHRLSELRARRDRG